MTIIYAAIGRAKDAAVLVDCCDPLLKGNAQLVTTLLLQHLMKLPQIPDNERRTFIHRNTVTSNDFVANFLEACSVALGEDDSDTIEEHYFHLYSKDDVYYVCLGDDGDVRQQKV